MNHWHLKIFSEWLTELIQNQSVFELLALNALLFSEPDKSMRVRFMGLLFNVIFSAFQILSLIIKQRKVNTWTGNASLAIVIATDFIIFFAGIWIFIAHTDVIYSTYLQTALSAMGLLGVGIVAYRLCTFLKAR